MDDKSNDTRTGQNPSPSQQNADPSHQENPQAGNLTFWQILSSTISAALGVQSRANRERDFTKGKATHFIIMGIAFTVMFVLAVVGVVNLVLP